MKGISIKRASSMRLMFLGLGLMVVMGMLVGLFSDKANAAEDTRRLNLIMKVNEVKVNFLSLQNQSPCLHISAQGEVGSAGWEVPQLVPVDTDCPRSVRCFKFRAKPPTWLTNPVISPVSADYKLKNWKHVKKIKVIAKANSITVPVENPGQLKTSQRQTFIGPVLLTKYAVHKSWGHIFWVDDPTKIQQAVAVKVSFDNIHLENLMVYAYKEGKQISVVPGSHITLPNGKKAMMIWGARIE